MKAIITLLILILLAGSINAQTRFVTIEGYLKTKIGNKEYPLENALITLLHHNRISQTNKKGFFSFKHISSEVYRFDIPEIFPQKVDTAIVVSHSSPKTIKIDLVIENVCKASRDSALKDIEEGKVKLLLQSGIAPVAYTTDSAFQKKYNLSYYDYGCIGEQRTCMQQYNRTIFTYLDETYGRKWRKEARKDVIGLKK